MSGAREPNSHYVARDGKMSITREYVGYSTTIQSPPFGHPFLHYLIPLTLLLARQIPSYRT